MVVSVNSEPHKNEFNILLNSTIEELNAHAIKSPKKIEQLRGAKLEPYVRDVMTDLAVGSQFENSIELIGGQKFPDIVAKKFYGIEVKTTTQNHWKTTGKMTSLEISELTGKEHGHLMRDIRKMEETWVKVGQSKFGLISYIDSQNREKPMYELSKTECLYIATKFNDEARAKLVLRWKDLEIDKQKPISRKELAYMVIEQEEKIEHQQKEIARLLPRSEFVDVAFNSDGLIAISQVAKILNLPYGRNTLFRVLRDKGVLFKSTNEPKQHFVDKGYFSVKEKIQHRKHHKPFVVLQTYASQKGLGYIAKLLGVINIKTPTVKFISA